MRDFKFRAWNGNSMYSPIISANSNLFRNIQDYIVANYAPYDDLMQYTGCYDIKNKMIFESDILHIEIRDFNTGKVICSASEVVIYKGDGFGVIWGHHRDFSYLSDFTEQACAFEVIGNVHQNPELLRTQEVASCN